MQFRVTLIFRQAGFLLSAGTLFLSTESVRYLHFLLSQKYLKNLWFSNLNFYCSGIRPLP